MDAGFVRGGRNACRIDVGQAQAGMIREQMAAAGTAPLAIAFFHDERHGKLMEALELRGARPILPSASARQRPDAAAGVVGAAVGQACRSQSGKDHAAQLAHAPRRCLDGLPAHASGWLAALHDRYVGPAMLRRHAEPAYPWTLEWLAGSAGRCSRAAAVRGHFRYRSSRHQAPAIPRVCRQAKESPSHAPAHGGDRAQQIPCQRATQNNSGTRPPPWDRPMADLPPDKF
jgi:hypothetical protein